MCRILLSCHGCRCQRRHTSALDFRRQSCSEEFPPYSPELFTFSSANLGIAAKHVFLSGTVFPLLEIVLRRLFEACGQLQSLNLEVARSAAGTGSGRLHDYSASIGLASLRARSLLRILES